MNEKEPDFEKLRKRKSPIKMPSNLEAVYDPKTGAFIGRRPIKLIDPMTGEERELKNGKVVKKEKE